MSRETLALANNIGFPDRLPEIRSLENSLLQIIYVWIGNKVVVALYNNFRRLEVESTVLLRMYEAQKNEASPNIYKSETLDQINEVKCVFSGFYGFYQVK